MKIHEEWCNLDLTVKILMLIGIILFLEQIISLFFYEIGYDTETDDFFRLVLGNVLGYFLGGINTNGNKIPFVNKVKTETISENKVNNPENPIIAPVEQSTHIRTFFVSSMCILSIIALTIVSFMGINVCASASTNLRTIISTTLGFLISKANRKA